jgi:hypothetical protein
MLLRILALVLTLALTGTACLAQQSGQAPATPDAPSASQENEQAHIANPIQGGAQLVNLLAKRSLVFPDLATSTGPLTSGDKFKLFVNNSVSFSSFFAAATSAGFNQAYNSPAGYGQGAEGYGKRYGAAMARNASAEFFGTWMLASALHEDPRFFVRRNISFGESVKYSIHRVFITRSDSGEQVVNVGGLVGPLAAEGLANVYFPDEYRTVGNTFSRYGYDLMWKAGANLLRQYWPSINRRLKLLPVETAAP